MWNVSHNLWFVGICYHTPAPGVTDELREFCACAIRAIREIRLEGAVNLPSGVSPGLPIAPPSSPTLGVMSGVC